MAEHRPNDSKELAKEYLREVDGMKQERQPFDPVWEQVADYAGVEFKGFTGKPSHPHPPKDGVVDSTVKRAAKVFSAGMQSGASSPSQRWFGLSYEDKNYADHALGKAWIQTVEDDFYYDLHRFGYYPQQHMGYHQTGLFGWQGLFVDAGMLSPMRFRTMPLPQLYIRENAQAEVDTVARSFPMTPRQAAQFFGEKNLPRELRNRLDRKGGGGKDEACEFIHFTFPAQDRTDFHPGRNALPVASFYMSVQDGQVVSEGGYRELPYIITRSHRLPGTPYSYSPGTEALADVKMMNEMKSLILEAGQLSMAPPYLVPDDGFVGRFSFEPRAMNYYRTDKELRPDSFAPLGVGGDPRFSWELLQSVKQDINEAFFVDLFLAIRQRTQAAGDATAHEIAELAAERMFLLGPMLVNQQRENFQRLFDRLFDIKVEQGTIPPPPPDLANQPLKVEYTSPLVLAQKESQTNSIMQGYQDAGFIAGIDPTVLDVLDHEENVRRLLAQRGFPVAGIRDRRQVEEIRNQRNQDMAEQQQKAELMEAAKLYPGLSKAPQQGSPVAEPEEDA